MWGPVALLLATPLTACLMVLARYLPSLRFLEIALGNAPVLEAPDRLYQRLLSRDTEESARLVSAHGQAHGYVDACDRLLLPALKAAAQDAASRRISEEEYEQVVTHARSVVELAAAPAPEAPEAQGEAASPAQPLRVLCVAREEIDQIGLLMLRNALDPRAFALELCSTDLLVSETVELMSRNRADAICIGSMPPTGVLAAKLLLRRMRKRFPQAPILVARWGGRAGSELDALRAAGASSVHTSIDALRLALIAECSARASGAASAAAPTATAMQFGSAS
jgi:hypothetical protein